MIDSFFYGQDQKLRQQFRERVEKMDRRAQLVQVSGIQDEAVLDRLIELKIEPETIAAMAVVPLFMVAWADGKVQDAERDAILAAAQSAGGFLGIGSRISAAESTVLGKLEKAFV